MNKKILVVDDEESVRYSFKRFLSNAGYLIQTAKNGRDALKIFSSDHFDLVILDIRLPDMSGLDVFREFRRLESKSVVLVMTAFGTTETAIEATKLGAYDYILKPFDIAQMRTLIEEAINCSYLMRTEVIIDSNLEPDVMSDRIIGSSPLMQEVYKLIGRVAGSDVNILLRGESGTGKELVARAIYQHSQRAAMPFIAVNCAAIPETLLESELFGYEKGAFTGAVRRKIGKFEQADGGILFLDEIGDMTLSTQAKILRVLQEGCFEHLGGEHTLHTNVRIIAATNRNLEKAIEEGKFREDLYYRIKVVTITLPPLRLRRGDISVLVHYFNAKYCREFGHPLVTFSENVMTKISNYSWPGNIRELENTIKRVIVLSKSNLVTEEFIDNELDEMKPAIQHAGIHPVINTDNLEKHTGSYYAFVMAETEKELIIQTMQKTAGNQVQTARILGISRVMLHDRLVKYGIKYKNDS